MPDLDFNRTVTERFRAGEGVEGMPRERLLLLTATGARSGQPRTTPLSFLRDGDRLVVFAADSGASKEPAWVANVRADANVVIEIGDERYDGN